MLNILEDIHQLPLQADAVRIHFNEMKCVNL
jgi:hypothetical protein